MIVNRQSISCREDELQGMYSGQPLQLDGGYPSGYFETTEYQVHTVNFKTYRQSYKSTKTDYNPEVNGLCLRIPMKRLLTLTPTVLMIG